MNALPASENFAVVSNAVWLVLRCSPARTLALAKALAEQGAWTPTWKRRRRMPRSTIYRPTTEPCIPSFVFIPEEVAFDLPQIPRIPFGFMRNADATLVRVSERSLEPLRKIADKPLVSIKKLPTPGTKVRFNEGPFEGLRGKVLACTIRYATIAVEGFSQPIQVPPCMVLKNWA